MLSQGFIREPSEAAAVRPWSFTCKPEAKALGRWSFTLLELVLVTIIIAVLTSLGVISFRGSIMRARVSQARHGIALIAQAEKIVQIDRGNYQAFVAGQADATIGGNVSGIDLQALDNDPDWKFAVADSTVTATKSNAPCAGGKLQYGLDNNTFSFGAACLQ